MESKPTLANSIYVSFVSNLEDPRASNRWHPIETVLFSLLVGILCGGNGFVQAAGYAQKKRAFIERYVPCPHGIPTHDTMGRLMAMLDPDAFADAFAFFMARMTGQRADDIINIDGKTLRGALSAIGRANKKGAKINDQVHMVSAFSNVRRCVLAQLRSKAVANEVAAAQELLRMVHVQDSVVTLDAAHNSMKTLQMIAERGGHAVLGVKANNEKLHKAIKAAFPKNAAATIDETENAHGRIEHRQYTIVAATGDYVCERWPTLKSFIRTTRHVTRKTGAIGKPAVTYYATSLPPDQGKKIADGVRQRWGIENKLHFVLDVTFDEDAGTRRVKNAAENFSRCVHVALNVLRAETTERVSLELKRGFALADDAYLETLIGPPPAP